MPVTRSISSPRALRTRDSNQHQAKSKPKPKGPAERTVVRTKKSSVSSSSSFFNMNKTVPPRPQPSKPQPVREVINLLSDDDEPPVKKTKTSAKGKSRASAASNASVILVQKPDGGSKRQQTELSGSVDGGDLSSLLKEKEKELAEMADELRRYKHILDEKREDVKTLTQEASSLRLRVNALQTERTKLVDEVSILKRRRGDANSIDAAEFEDIISCEICTIRMWSPFMITDCGHVFCETCLRGWFDTTYSQHLAQHPGYLTPPVIPRGWYEHRHNRDIARQINQFVQDYWRRMPAPKYSCPACRTEVKQKPVVVYKLKDVARVVGRAMGELEPEVQVQVPQQRSGAGRHHAGEGPFDAFFRAREGYVVR